ncbi:hypothetical protein QYE76_034727 [Lolium multiflorum]|uniref:Uncharacterized protein n=1 Tax=Lolium multiflorum TaxID=4521 RepID=A0AAD8R148_LOLMU|nr:hypothetical protein QYE76_034727 [Lolium multiflorum]
MASASGCSASLLPPTSSPARLRRCLAVVAGGSGASHHAPGRVYGSERRPSGRATTCSWQVSSLVSLAVGLNLGVTMTGSGCDMEVSLHVKYGSCLTLRLSLFHWFRLMVDVSP